jgi:hypothetical protein
MFENNFFYSWPPTFGAKSRRPNTKKLLQLYAWRLGHGSKQFFCFQSPILDVESRRSKDFFLPWPYFEFPSFVLGVLNMANIKCFCFWPSTFNVKSRPKVRG